MMWFRNLQIYRLTSFDLSAEELSDALEANPLTAPTGVESQRFGWVSPNGNDEEFIPFVHQYGQQMLIALGVEKKLLPASVVNQFAKDRAAQIEEQQGYKPGRKQMKQIKEAVTDELLPRAFVQRRITRAWIDPVNMRLVVDASSAGRGDEVAEVLLKHVEGIAIVPLKTQLSPMTSMTGWLLGCEAPAGFTLDDSCELRATGDTKATVRYTSNAPDHDEVRKHVESGKATAKLAMTWNDRISFVLDDNLQVKRVAPLDVLTEQADADDDAFNSDFALMTGEVAKLIDDLVVAFGGEVTK